MRLLVILTAAVVACLVTHHTGSLFLGIACGLVVALVSPIEPTPPAHP